MIHLDAVSKHPLSANVHNATGRAYANGTEHAGAGGWIMSTFDLAKFWTHLKWGTFCSTPEFILNPNPNVAYCIDMQLSTPRGTVVGKAGSYSLFNAGYQAFVCDFPGDVQVVFTTNCDMGDPNFSTNIVGWLLSAYNAS